MIELAQPLALAALAALPVIVALHLLRPRRRDVTVPSSELWREALRERRRGLGLQRLLRNTSLLLLLLAALAAAVALADPRRVTRAALDADSVLVLDVSASMRTRDGAGTRFDRALGTARALVDALPEGARMLIVSAGRRAVLRSGFETDKDTLRRALAGIEPGDEAGRPREALALALSLLRARERARVHFVTDAAFDPAAVPDSPRIEVHRVGAAARNVAITRFDFRPEPGGEDRFQVLLTVRNYTADALEVPATIALERRTLVERTLALAPGAEHTLVLAFQGKAFGRARARIDTGDDLAADDEAFAVINVPDPLRVLLVTPGNFFLESVLGAMAGVDVAVADAIQADAIERLARAHDVVVLDRVPAPALPPGNFVLLATVPPGLPFAAEGTLRAPAIAGRGNSALLRDVDLGGVRIDEALRVSLRDGAPGVQRLFWAADGELALALLAGDTRVVWLGFDLARSSLPLQAAFPLFFGHALEWLRPRAGAADSTALAAGEAVTLVAPAAHGEAIVRLPSGEGRTLALDNGTTVFEDTTRAGIYRYAVNQVTRYFAVNAGDREESDVNPRAPAAAAPRAEAAGADEAQVIEPLWPMLAALALLALALEWALRCTRAGDA